jgi:hypothetical protein
MANTVWRAERARCPFYRKSYDVSVTCSVNENETIRYRFSTEARCDEHFRRHCAVHYMSCPIYKLIEKIIGIK